MTARHRSAFSIALANNAPHTLRAARREREPADIRVISFGFRVARTF